METPSFRCEEHGKTLDSYCKRHDAPLCSSCALSHHRSCEDIIPLEDAAKNSKQSTALTDVQETISVGLKNIQAIIQNTTPEYLVVDEKKIKETIREVRTKIDHQLDEMEQNLILDLNSKLASCKSKINEVLKCVKKSEKIMKHLKDQTNEMKNCVSDLHIFIKTRELNKEVHACLKSTMTRNVIEKYNINVEIDKALKSFLTDVETFGKIDVEVTKTHVQLSQPKITQAQKPLYTVTKNFTEIEVNLKQTFTIKKESKDMEVTGCAILPNGDVLVADYRGKKQLMQYNQNGTHVRDIPVSREPYDLTMIDSDRVAVSYRMRYIEILNRHNTTVEKKVDLDNITWGLSYQGGKLYVVVDRRGIVVIDMSGKIVNTININVNYVWYVTTTTDRIYYSDWIEDTVTCCDMSGKQIWEFKDDYVQIPYGLTIDNNQNVIVAGGSGLSGVVIISQDGQKSKILLNESDGLFHPRAIYLDKHTGDIFVCNESDQKVFLYKLSS